METLIDNYQKVCQESRQICAKFALDDLAINKSKNGVSPSLRWIYLHMIEETARHAGHLDIYREILDGQSDHDI